MDVIIPLYFCDPVLYQPIKSCLDALERSKADLSIILVDDASPLDHTFYTGLKTTYFQNRQNQGFTKTVNTGLKMSHADTLVIMNDDIIIIEECLERFSKLSGLVIASPMDTASSDDDRFGACWGMTREVYELLGPLNEEYRNFYSDTDYYNRAKATGVEIIKWKDITLEHPESSTYKLLDKEALLEDDRKRFMGV